MVPAGRSFPRDTRALDRLWPYAFGPFHPQMGVVDRFLASRHALEVHRDFQKLFFRVAVFGAGRAPSQGVRLLIKVGDGILSFFAHRAVSVTAKS